MMNHEIYDGDLRAATAGLEDAFAGRRFLITGATGLIGSFLADALMALDNGVEIYAAGRSAEGMRRRFGDRLDDAHFHYVPYDAAKPARFDFDVDYIVHAACSAHPLAYSKDPAGTMRANLTGTLELLEYLRGQDGANCRVVVPQLPPQGFGGQGREEVGHEPEVHRAVGVVQSHPMQDARRT